VYFWSTETSILYSAHCTRVYNLDIQVEIPSALYAIHNFIHQYDAEEELEDVLGSKFSPDLNDLNEYEFQPSAEEDDSMDAGLLHDQIAKKMWKDYLQVLDERGIKAPNGFYNEDSDNKNDSDSE